MAGQEARFADDVSPAIFSQAWYPKREAWRRPPGKPPVARMVPAVSGYVLVKTDSDVPWHTLRSIKGYIRAVGGVNPRVITDAEIQAMSQIPDTLQAIVDAALMFATIRRGDQAVITSGVMAGNLVSVADIKGTDAIADMGDIRITVPVARLQKQGLPSSADGL